jgi:protein TonB
MIHNAQWISSNRSRRSRSPDALFNALFALTCIGAACVGLYFSTIKPLQRTSPERVVHVIKSSFSLQEPKPVEKPKPMVRKEKTPVELSKNSEPEKNPEPPKVEEPPKPRKVYGLRRVYATGLGAGGTLSEAVIGKLGNTIEKNIDTLVATKEDIKGEIVSVTSVTTAPSFRKKTMPEYTKEMLDKRIEGVVRVKALVDIDGRVKKALPLNDLGCSAASQALKATLCMEFNPAMRDKDPVAVWIIIPIRFVMIG